MPADRIRRTVVGMPAEGDSFARLQRARAGWCQRQHLDVDSLVVHCRDASLPDVLEARKVVAHVVERDAVVALGFGQRCQGGGEFGGTPVLFDGNDCHDLFLHLSHVHCPGGSNRATAGVEVSSGLIQWLNSAA